MWLVSKALKNYWGAGNDFEMGHVKKQLSLAMLFRVNTESVIISLALLRLCVHNFVLLTVKLPHLPLVNNFELLP